MAKNKWQTAIRHFAWGQAVVVAAIASAAHLILVTQNGLTNTIAEPRQMIGTQILFQATLAVYAQVLRCHLLLQAWGSNFPTLTTQTSLKNSSLISKRHPQQKKQKYMRCYWQDAQSHAVQSPLK